MLKTTFLLSKTLRLIFSAGLRCYFSTQNMPFFAIFGNFLIVADCVTICAQMDSLVSNEKYDLEFVYNRPQNHMIGLRWAGKGRQLHHEGFLKA